MERHFAFLGRAAFGRLALAFVRTRSLSVLSECPCAYPVSCVPLFRNVLFCAKRVAYYSLFYLFLLFKRAGDARERSLDLSFRLYSAIPCRSLLYGEDAPVLPSVCSLELTSKRRLASKDLAPFVPCSSSVCLYMQSPCEPVLFLFVYPYSSADKGKLSSAKKAFDSLQGSLNPLFCTCTQIKLLICLFV